MLEPSKSPCLAAEIEQSKELNRIFILAETDFYLEGMIHVIGRDPWNRIAACVKPGDNCWNHFIGTPTDVLMVHRSVVTAPMGAFFARFKSAAPQVRILVFGQGMDDDYLYRLIRSGADGYVRENLSGDQLLTSLRVVRSGQIWAERHILARFVRGVVELEDVIESIIQGKIESLGQSLTRRESQVFQLVLKGLSTKEISDELFLSQQSVKLYLGKIFQKFDVTNRSQLILMAFERVCPVSNMIRLFRMTLDKNRIKNGKSPVIPDPLDEQSQVMPLLSTTLQP
jgi:DNA-binding NarL/FixJ family response regulator